MDKRKALIVVLVAGVFVAGSVLTMPLIPGTDAHAKSLAIRGIASMTRDPSSAQFQSVKLVSSNGGNDLVCGGVNARNGFGAYAGYQRFIYDPAARVGDIDPQDQHTFEDLDRAYKSCSFAGTATCESGDTIKQARAAQRQFNATWRSRCASAYREM